MAASLDVQMPIRKGSFVIGKVLETLLHQRVPLSLYVDATADLPLTPEVKQLLEQVAVSTQEARRIAKSTRAAFKRNKLRECGESDYVYLADPDVLLPSTPFLEVAMESLATHFRLGAIGVCYHTDSEHVACGAMLMRRVDFLGIGELRGTARTCVCGYIQEKLRERGLATIPLRKLRATHLKREYRDGYPDYPAVHYTVGRERRLSQDTIQHMLHEHGTRFKLFIDHE